MGVEMSGQVDLSDRDAVFKFLGENLLNAKKVGELTGLASQSVYVYLQPNKAHLNFPRPIPEISSPRCMLWWRQDILDWIDTRKATVGGRYLPVKIQPRHPRRA